MKLLLLFFALCWASAPPRPNISNVFSAQGTIIINVAGTNVTGTSTMAFNQPKGKGLEEWNFPSYPSLTAFYLQRFDLNMTYEMDGPNPKTCTGKPIDMPMNPLWQFLSNATYLGQYSSYGVQANVWQSNIGYVQWTVGVSVSDPTTPRWTRRVSPAKDHTVIFSSFTATVPSDSLFNLPKQCTTPILPVPEVRPHSKEGCIDRNTIISRGDTWVKAHVPYNQQGTYGGYREDCSGFVSMTWELAKPGLTTFTLGTVSHRISKDELMPGDVLLDASEHVVLFGGWANGAKSQYIALEETRPGEGTVKRSTPYPYWYNQAAFIPYRYNKVC